MKPYYADEAVTLYHGDYREILPALSDVSRPIVVTDPPYLTKESGITQNNSRVGKVYRPSKAVGMPWGFSLEWVESVACFSPQQWVVFCNYQMLGELQTTLDTYAEAGCVFVWRKSNAPNMARPVPRLDCEFILWHRHKKATCARMGEFKSMVIDVPMPQAGCMRSERVLEPGSGKALHPCQKPLAVVMPFVVRLSTADDVILDPFCGTGTTLLASKNAGIRSVGIELEEKYCEAIAERLAQGVLAFE